MVCKGLCTLANRTSRNPFSFPISLVNTTKIAYYFLLSYFTRSGAASPSGCTPAPSPDLSPFGVETNCGSERDASGSWEGIWEALLFLWLSIWFATSLPITYLSCHHQSHVIPELNFKIPRFTYIVWWYFTSLLSSISCLNLC